MVEFSAYKGKSKVILIDQHFVYAVKKLNLSMLYLFIYTGFIERVKLSASTPFIKSNSTSSKSCQQDA